jgi:hypothetical protein
MLKKLILSISVIASGSTCLFAMDHGDRISFRYNCFDDALGSKGRTVEKTRKLDEDTIKDIILQSRWYNQHNEGKNEAEGKRGRITLFTLPEDAIKSTTIDGARVDSEGRNPESGPKFRLQSGKTTFASVRVDPTIEFLYPSQLAKALYLSATSGKRKVIQ